LEEKCSPKEICDKWDNRHLSMLLINFGLLI
jgi:hypothetical protein